MPVPIQIADLNNAKVDVDHIADIANSEALTAVDRLGRTKDTLEGKLTAFDTSLSGRQTTWDNSLSTRQTTWDASLATKEGEFDAVVAASETAAEDQRDDIQAAADIVLAGIGYAPPVAYTAGIDLTTVTQTVSYDGAVYAPTAASLPFTTSGSFESGNFRLIQGVSGADLAASSGAGMVGYIDEGTGAVYLSLLSKIRQSVPVHASEFGAVADGSTDNAAAFNDLANCRADLISIILDEGTYGFGRTASTANTGTGKIVCSSNIRFLGKGRDRTILAELHPTLDYDGNLFWLEEDVSADFQNLTIQGPTTMPSGGATVAEGGASPQLAAIHFDNTPGTRVVRLNDVAITGWYTCAFQKSQGTGAGRLFVEMRDCDLTAYHGCVKVFAPNDIEAYFHAYHTKFRRGGIPFGHPGYPYDHTHYIHPHVNVYFKGCSFPQVNGNKFGFRHFSSGGKTSAHARYAIMEDCDLRQTAMEVPISITIGSPGVVTLVPNHSVTNGTSFTLSTSGTLPTGLVAGTTYFVVNADSAAGTFQLSLTSGGAAINTSGTQDGQHYVVSPKGAAFEQSDIIPLELVRCKLSGDAQASLVKPPGTYFYHCGTDYVPCEGRVNDAPGGGSAHWIDGVWRQRTGSNNSSHNYPGQWSVKGTRVHAVASGAAFIDCGGTSDKLHVEDVECVSTLSGADTCSSPFTASAGSADIEIVGGSIRGKYGTLNVHGLFHATGTWTGTAEISHVNGRRLESTASKFVTANNTSIPADAIRVRNCALGAAPMRVATGGNRQLVEGSRGASPTQIASASSIAPTYEYDAYEVTGTTTINTILMNGSANSQLAFTGTIRLMAVAGWALGTAGNIVPRSTSARTVGEVVTLTWFPAQQKWYE